jgi:hypothetical protein
LLLRDRGKASNDAYWLIVTLSYRSQPRRENPTGKKRSAILKRWHREPTWPSPQGGKPTTKSSSSGRTPTRPPTTKVFQLMQFLATLLMEAKREITARNLDLVNDYTETTYADVLICQQSASVRRPCSAFQGTRYQVLGRNSTLPTSVYVSRWSLESDNKPRGVATLSKGSEKSRCSINSHSWL